MTYFTKNWLHSLLLLKLKNSWRFCTLTDGPHVDITLSLCSMDLQFHNEMLLWQKQEPSYTFFCFWNMSAVLSDEFSYNCKLKSNKLKISLSLLVACCLFTQQKMQAQILKNSGHFLRNSKKIFLNFQSNLKM